MLRTTSTIHRVTVTPADLPLVQTGDPAAAPPDDPSSLRGDRVCA